MRTTAVDRHVGPVCLKTHALGQWAARHLGSIEHERRVKELATRIFDLTGPLHGLGAAERRLLRLAALVHDVGRAVDDDTHPQVGARMVREDEHLPLTAGERRALAFLTRYHKGSVPAPGRDRILRRKDDHATLRLILGLLRAADALDNRRLESPRLTMSMEGRRLRIACQLTSDCPKARRVYTRRKKFRLLEEQLGCSVDVTVTGGKSLQLVA